MHHTLPTMAKQRLRKSQLSKSRGVSVRPKSSSRKVVRPLQILTDEESVLTLPLQLVTVPPTPQSPLSAIHQDPEEGYGEIEVRSMRDDHSTLTNELSSIHYDGFSEGGKEPQSVHSFGLASPRTNKSKQSQGSKKIQSRIVAHRRSLLDAESSETTESL